VRENPWQSVFKQAQAMEMVPRADAAVAMWARLIRNGAIFNTPEAFLASAIQQAGQTGDEARLSAAAQAATSLNDWARAGDLHERVQWLRRTLANLDIDIRLKRINPGGPAFDEAWRRVREVYLSIVSDSAGGRFAGLGADIEQGLSALAGARAK